MTDPRITAARDLLLEATTAEVVGALAAAGVGHISLKGPVLKRRLFPGGDEHVSADVDVLVNPDDWAGGGGPTRRPRVRATAAGHHPR